MYQLFRNINPIEIYGNHGKYVLRLENIISANRCISAYRNQLRLLEPSHVCSNRAFLSVEFARLTVDVTPMVSEVSCP